MTTNKCVVLVSSEGTPCSVCPAQSKCSIARPAIVSISPSDGGTHGDSRLAILLVFTMEMRWCAVQSSASKVSFWCDGSIAREVSNSSIQLLGQVMRVDVTTLLQSVSRVSQRECGLIIAEDVICGGSAGFPGLPIGAYSLKLRDGEAPIIDAFEPRNGASDMGSDSVVEITFSEQVVLGPHTLFISVSRLMQDSAGVATLENRPYPLELPHVRLGTSRKSVQIDLEGKLRSGSLYSLSLPAGAVVDLAGNKFAGLPTYDYTFRATPGVSRAGESSDSGSRFPTTLVVTLVVVGVLVACLLLASLAFLKLFGVGSGPLKRFKEPSVRPVAMPVPTAKQRHSQGEYADHGQSHRSVAQGSPQPRRRDSGLESSGDSWATRPDGFPGPPFGQGASRVYPTGDPGPQPVPSAGSRGRSEKGSPGAGRYSSSEPEGAGAKSDPRRRSGSQPRSSHPSSGFRAGSSPPPGASGPQADHGGARRGENASASTATSPVVESTCQEAKAVEKRMRAQMNEPLAIRKKVLKDLMLEYHPDKNSGEHAKEVFQFINGARGWFLHDA